MKVDYERLKPRNKWRTWIAEELTEADVLLPTFPNGYNAVYDEWKIYFEKLMPFFSDDVRLVGHSLGAMFLIKYLNRHRLKSKIRQLILVAPGYNDSSVEGYGSFAIETANNLSSSAEEIHFFHSSDDPIVPFAELSKFEADLTTATFHKRYGRGHFLDETFPELLDILKKN